MGSIPGKRKKFPWGYAVAALVVIAVSVAAMFLTGGTKVTITPVVNAVAVNATLSATPSSGDLPFETVTVEQVGTKEVKAEGTVEANDAAQGQITIYNAQDKPQELIKNTRFETPDGLIFRIHDSVSVPAGTTDAPGHLDITAYADAGGASYNIGPSTFTLPGLKGGALYDKVYAKSTASMTGGFSGQRPSVGTATHDAAQGPIQESLKGDLATAVAGKVPDGYVLIPGAIFYTFSALPDAAGTADSVKIQVQGSATAYVFPKEALAEAIATQTVGSYAGQEVTLGSPDKLTFATPDGATPPDSADSISFLVSGNVNIIWVVDPTKIAGSIAGKSRDAAKTLLAGYPEIDHASLVLRPFWEGSLPSDPSKIEVVVETPKGQ
jgi:hypothetical protein